jgi:hypothetical protein
MKWEDSDASRFRDYDNKTKGKLRLFLKTRIPIVSGKTIEDVALQAMFKQGFESALQEVENCANLNTEDIDPAAGTFTSM